MPRIKKDGSTLRQVAYARRVFSADGPSKRQIALDVGYGPNVANSVTTKIENLRGFNNAMAKLAQDSNLVALAVLHEFKARGVSEFSNKELVNSLNAISTAWARFNKSNFMEMESGYDKSIRSAGSKLRTVILQNIAEQNINNSPTPSTSTREEPPSVASSPLVDNQVDNQDYEIDNEEDVTEEDE